MNTEFAYQYPCNNGTFNNVTRGQSDDVCELCSPGYYCPNQVCQYCTLKLIKISGMLCQF